MEKHTTFWIQGPGDTLKGTVQLNSLSKKKLLEKQYGYIIYGFIYRGVDIHLGNH